MEVTHVMDLLSAASKTLNDEPLFHQPDFRRFRPAETLATQRKKPPEVGGF